MIRIERPADAPEILRTRGRAAAEKLCERHAAGEREFTFNSSLYADASVKDALVAMQHHKCAFCEQIVGHDSDVEHFRPKGGYRQSADSDLVKPGYYWLAYDWENLMLACGPCNSRYKKNLFPLENDRRAACHTDDLSAERPTFIDPTRDDPETFIGWSESDPFAKGLNRRAELTIDSLKLDVRDGLAIEHRQHLDDVKKWLTVFRIAEVRPQDERALQISHEARTRLLHKLSPEARFLAMTRAYLAAQNFMP